MNLVFGKLLLPAFAPLVPVGAGIAELLADGAHPLADIMHFARLALPLRCYDCDGAVRFVERIERRLHARHHSAVELYLLANMPIERASHQPLDSLDRRTDGSGTARVHRSNGSHFGF